MCDIVNAINVANIKFERYKRRHIYYDYLVLQINKINFYILNCLYSVAASE